MQRLPWDFSSLSAHYFVSEANKQASKQASKQACFWFLTLFDIRSKRAHSHTRKSRVRNHFNNRSIKQSINQFTKTFYVSLRWSKFSDTFLIIGQSACRHLAHVHHSRLVVHKLRQNELMNPVNADWMLSKLDNSLIIASSVQLNPLKTHFSFGKFEIYMTKHHA